MLLMRIKLRGGSNGRGGMLWKGGVPYIHGCCGGLGFPTSILIITIRFPAPWRKCNATGAEDDDDDVDVGVDGDDGGVIYYYYCDYYSLQVSKDRGEGKRGGPVQLQSKSR